MKKTSFIVFALALLFICRPLMAQTSFKDLPVDMLVFVVPTVTIIMQLVEPLMLATMKTTVSTNGLKLYANCINKHGIPTAMNL